MGTARVEAKEKEGTRAEAATGRLTCPRRRPPQRGGGKTLYPQRGSSAGASQVVVADPAGGVCGHGGAAPG